MSAHIYNGCSNPAFCRGVDNFSFEDAAISPKQHRRNVFVKDSSYQYQEMSAEESHRYTTIDQDNFRHPVKRQSLETSQKISDPAISPLPSPRKYFQREHDRTYPNQHQHFSPGQNVLPQQMNRSLYSPGHMPTKSRAPPTYPNKTPERSINIVTSPFDTSISSNHSFDKPVRRAILPPKMPIVPQIIHMSPKKQQITRGYVQESDIVKPSMMYYPKVIPTNPEPWIQMSPSTQTQEMPMGTIAVAAIIMIFGGLFTIGMDAYFLSKDGRHYYLDFSLMSGLTALLLGCLGFRSRHWKWFPNRNYVSGYIVLSFFSLLTSAGLLTLLILKPKAGDPISDITGGAICGIAILSLILSGLGITTSHCCKYPPPDNRVTHCAEGITL